MEVQMGTSLARGMGDVPPHHEQPEGEGAGKGTLFNLEIAYMVQRFNRLIAELIHHACPWNRNH